MPEKFMIDLTFMVKVFAIHNQRAFTKNKNENNSN